MINVPADDWNNKLNKTVGQLDVHVVKTEDYVNIIIFPVDFKPPFDDPVMKFSITVSDWAKIVEETK